MVEAGSGQPPPSYKIEQIEMIDTVLMRLTADEAGGVDFMEETAAYLDASTVCQFVHSGGAVGLSGKLGGLSLSVTPHRLKVKGGSLCKWQLGDNYSDMGRRDVQHAVERLSDELHVDMSRAVVTRLDVGHCMMMKHPTEVYLHHLGQYKRARRLEEPHTLYYDTRDERLAFYNKNREVRDGGGTVPELYRAHNVLRFEQRHVSHVGAAFQVRQFTASMLYDERTYIEMCRQWANAYNDIEKINDIQLNCIKMTGKKDLYRQSVRAVVMQMGGETAMFQQISDAQRRGEISPKTACDLRQAVRDACKADGDLVVPSEAVAELNAKVKEAVRYYR